MAYFGWNGTHTLRRRVTQIAFAALFALFPIFDLLRFDFSAGKLWVFRNQIWLDEWTLVWLALMFGMWIVGAVTLIFGRVYCSYACPQTVFTELVHDIEDVAKRLARKARTPQSRKRIERVIATAAIALLSIIVSALFLGYFAPLPDVLRRIVHLDAGPWVGAIGVATTLIIFLDLLLVRERFCRSVCPYGLLQGVLTDERSLHVRFDDPNDACIHCNLCARVCNMGIDIRNGAFQMECTRCGSCIDACDRVFEKKARPGLIGYSFGSQGARAWDLKRSLVALSTMGFGTVFVIAVALREPITFHLSPLYEGSAHAAPSPEIAEAHYLLRAANKSKGPVQLAVDLEGLPGGSVVEGLADGRVPAGEERDFRLSVRVPAATLKGSVTPFTCVVHSGGESRRFSMTFYARRQT